MDIALLGIPMDLGAGRRGVDMGPSALRNARLSRTLRDIGHRVSDLGDVPVPLPETRDKHEESGLIFLEPILQACTAAGQQLAMLGEEVFPISMGGDHSISVGTVTGAARSQRSGLIWVDAHTDFNTPASSPSGNIHGMPVAHLVGLGDAQLNSIGGGWHMRPEDIVMIGIRSVDRRERDLVREQGITVYTMKEVDQLGISRIAEETLERLGSLPRLHVSFDADALDPSLAPGVGTPVPGGLTYREAHLLMELLSESGRVTSMDIVEVNPALDHQNQTAHVMVGMAASLLGKRIL
ncbi:arginase [Deinococcus peraridilitoris]|uniref:Arginase n=1 Tax=Deinococcus peraridilitoris (strain DSM 19664 / LMG 22246 / CIP 109416 / KR-200) TaxID=937777 RepID=K9ZYL9_DEIPD|nr:arginase [Deinococcus peraridilitoris]AFZ66671.1 arginase [Deinococcus peraridilitoris DSM 19664]